MLSLLRRNRGASAVARSRSSGRQFRVAGDRHPLDRGRSERPGVAAGPRDGTLSDSTRLRLARVGAQVAHQRETLARATAALDRAVEVLMPATAPRTLYSAQGLPELPSRIGSITA